MKIKTKQISYDQAMSMEKYAHRKPLRQWCVLRWLLWILCFFDLLRMGFRVKQIGMEKLKKDEPCLILMNHSAFLDMKMIARIFGSRPYQIVCTLDAFIGNAFLMRLLGCIPTKKYISDINLVKDMVYTVKELKSSIVMYPEASYCFDGTNLPLPDSLGKCIKILQVPVVLVRSHTGFLRDPLYNGLQIRKVKQSAEVEYFLSPEDIKEHSASQINEMLERAFTFDHFRYQQENRICVDEPFRADGLNRVLYKCPHCLTEGQMVGKGTALTCEHCGKGYELTKYGELAALEGVTEFDHIPDWFRWERQCVRKEVEDHAYQLDVPVDIYMVINTKCVYKIGEGQLYHSAEGFHLKGCDGKLDYRQRSDTVYTVTADFFWYEIDDVLCIGDANAQYYCVVKGAKDVVAKAKLATEEMYKIRRESRKSKKEVSI